MYVDAQTHAATLWATQQGACQIMISSEHCNEGAYCGAVVQTEQVTYLQAVLHCSAFDGAACIAHLAVLAISPCQVVVAKAGLVKVGAPGTHPEVKFATMVGCQHNMKLHHITLGICGCNTVNIRMVF